MSSFTACQMNTEQPHKRALVVSQVLHDIPTLNKQTNKQNENQLKTKTMTKMAMNTNNFVFTSKYFKYCYSIQPTTLDLKYHFFLSDFIPNA